MIQVINPRPEVVFIIQGILQVFLYALDRVIACRPADVYWRVGWRVSELVDHTRLRIPISRLLR